MRTQSNRQFCAFAASASLLALSVPSLAWAQAAPSPSGTAQEPAQTSADSTDVQTNRDQEIIVTGVVRKTRKLDTTFTIDTLDQKDIQRLAPISTADLLNNIPGFFAEGSTAGERSNNVTVRGLPSSGYRYAPQLIDGLPVYQDSDVPFANNDVFFSNDLMTDRVEVVKGGPGGVLYSNGLGAIVNYVTKTGGDKFEGGYKLELATYDFIRNDVYIAGPINDSLHFAVGGFFRTSGGLRDTGYTADKGGQIRGNLTWNSADGKTSFGLYASHLNDRTAVYNNLPIEVPGFTNPGTADNPIRIDNNTVKPIGIAAVALEPVRHPDRRQWPDHDGRSGGRDPSGLHHRHRQVLQGAGFRLALRLRRQLHVRHIRLQCVVCRQRCGNRGIVPEQPLDRRRAPARVRRQFPSGRRYAEQFVLLQPQHPGDLLQRAQPGCLRSAISHAADQFGFQQL